MTVQITVEVPDRLSEEIRRYQDRLPELLERGLRDLQSEDAGEPHDVAQIVEVLAGRPTPDEILAIAPSPALQGRLSHLLERNKTASLTRAEEAELERYLTLEHIVRLAKAHALQQKASA